MFLPRLSGNVYPDCGEQVSEVAAHDGVFMLDMGPNWNSEMGPIGALASGQMDQVKAIKAALGR